MGNGLVIGLTGGIGSGKSAVTRLFEKHGIDVIDADEVAREVVAPGSEGLAKVVGLFGGEILDEQGRLNRGRLREQVFADEEKRKRLEAIVHPRIRDVVRARTQRAASAYCVVCLPLLFETAQDESYDRVLVVDVPRNVQIERTIDRDGSPRATIEGILSAQLDRQQRLERADDVIDNSGSLEDLAPQVSKLHRHYLELAAGKTVDGADQA